MIPKVIHYIWLGGKPLPEMVKKCMKSWKKQCPDWEIKRWDESNLDIDFCKYCRQAYNEKKYAFASDALRFKIIKENGGVYLDVDVELLNPLDDLLKQKCFMGYENCGEILAVNPGLILGSEKNGKVVSEITDRYMKDSFYFDNGEIDLETVCFKTMRYLKDTYNIDLNGENLELKDITLYSSEYFCPINPVTKEENTTNNTYSKHLYLASWRPKQRFLSRVKNKIKNILKKVFRKKDIKNKP